MRIFSFVLISFIYLGSTLVKAQQSTIHFDVIYAGKSIGTLTASKEVEGKKNVKNLSSTTDSKALVISEQIESEVRVQSDGEIMTSTTAYRHAKREPEDIQATTTRGTGNTYDIVKNGAKIQLTHVGIKFCVADLYFSEPIGISSIYSSALGTFFPIKYVSKGVYKIVFPDGKTTTFTYVDGKLTQAIAITSLGDILIKRK